MRFKQRLKMAVIIWSLLCKAIAQTGRGFSSALKIEIVNGKKYNITLLFVKR